MNNQITRRKLLGDAAKYGAIAPIMIPFLRSITAHATDDGKMPKRFVFVIKASGIDNYNLMPPTVAARKKVVEYHEDSYKHLKPPTHTQQINVSFDDHPLPKILEPLKPFKDRVNIIQGLSGNHLKGNHTSGYGALSCYNSELVPVAPTVDALLGLRHSTGPYPMFGMATNGTLRGQVSVPDDAYVYPNLSAFKSGQGVAFQASPTKAFNELFGSAVMSPSELKKEGAIQRNLMEFLKEDARRIRKKLTNSFDRERFDGYIDTFESLRLRDQKKAGLKERIKRNAPTYVADKYTAMNHMDRMECHFELAAAAIVAGLTNVVTLRPDTLGAQYRRLGTGSLGLHQIGHGASSGELTSPQLRRRIVNYQLGLIAKLAKRFASIPEGDGSMLDHTLIVYTSCAGGQHHAGSSDWPMITIGGLGGRLKLGRYLQYPSYAHQGHKTIANMYMTLMTAADTSYGDHFGQIDPGLRDLDVRGPLPELLN